MEIITLMPPGHRADESLTAFNDIGQYKTVKENTRDEIQIFANVYGSAYYGWFGGNYLSELPKGEVEKLSEHYSPMHVKGRGMRLGDNNHRLVNVETSNKATRRASNMVIDSDVDEDIGMTDMSNLFTR
ncbi:hypothetical protein SARC_09349 [Sphaeroforma arctica JP610]|uniref:Uncharacterized protein n=1 Tax=Sphaeroforma arctica JP610 TaxID=667725 RepID=A0A0L0FNA3_9EUKA|nr:hypothetical protein SARC_09349 [Sphaeroforma arctica JP610]KNC78209.1 hypothetical protein SARC_09349 [Sphaeroforma arctica JP610]|eukprot:XP_014152111.1 hypothetical protein SARC_09349 [Sphaeroforma arctica JP610]